VLVITLQQLVTTTGRYSCVTCKYLQLRDSLFCRWIECKMITGELWSAFHTHSKMRQFSLRHKVCASASAKRSHMRWLTLGLSENWQRSIPWPNVIDIKRDHILFTENEGTRVAAMVVAPEGTCPFGGRFWNVAFWHCFFLRCGQKHRCYQALFTQ